MSLTYLEAYDLVAGVVETAWKATGAATETDPLHWDGVRSEKPGESPVAGDESGPFGRFVLRTSVRGLNAQGGSRTRLFETTAALVVQCFAPWGDGGNRARVMAEVVMAALETYVGSAAGVWFADVTPQEIGRSGDHFQINVVGNVRYQQRRAV